MLFVFGGLAMVAPAPAAVRVPPTQASTLALASRVPGGIDKTLDLPFRANMIGVTWNGPKAVVNVQTHAPDGAWSAWKNLEMGDNSPDAGSEEWRLVQAEQGGRKTTTPYWVGLADRVRIKLDFVPGSAPNAEGGFHDVRLSVINTAGNGKPESTWLHVAHKIGAWLTGAPAQEANAAPQTPVIKTRNQWGANERWRRCCPKYSTSVESVIVHHTDDSNTYTQADAPAVVRAIYHYHRYSRDYDDIAYNFLIDRFGTIYEGRFGGIDKAVMGAHSEGMNHQTVGIALIGTFNTVYPSRAMSDALAKLLTWKMDLHHIPASGTVQMTSSGSHKLRKGQVIALQRIAGHRDVQSTDCPGNRFYGMLPGLRTKVMGWGSPKFYVDSQPRLIRPGDGKHDSATVKFWSNDTLNWKINFADPSGKVRRSVTGSGKSGEGSWDGVDSQTTALSDTGIGFVTVEATDAHNRRATMARIPLYIVNTHPGGTVLTDGTTQMLVDAQGVSHQITSSSVFQSWFRPKELVKTTAEEMTRYSPGKPLDYRPGTLIKTETGTHWWMYRGSRRAFASAAVFNALGYTDAGAISASEAEIATIPQGTPIVDASVHPDGTVFVDGSKASWVISGGERHRVPSKVVRASTYRDKEVVSAKPGDSSLPVGGAVTFRMGTLLQAPDDSLWIIVDGKRFSIDSTMFGLLGYSSAAVLKATWPELNIAAYGGVI
ncbi:MAG: hypothetical protein NVSMB57_04970 [Actinomycetota bacterium]